MPKILLPLTLLLTFTFAGAASLQTNVTLKVPGATLAGTLQKPEKAGAKVLVMLILPGSGPTDRDGNSAAGPAGTYRKLAAELAAQGIASLRIDKRGIGRSVAQDTREEALNFNDYAADARAWLDWLSRQPGLGPVGLVGHSEGGLVALAAVQKSSPAKALVLLSTPGEPLGATIRRQLSQNRANPPALVREAGDILTQLEAGKTVPQVSPLLLPLFRPSVQPYLMSELSLDPARLVAATTLPTLIVQGDHDLQVRPDDARLLAAAQKRASLKMIPGMNHVLVPAPLDMQANFATYADASLPLDKGAVRAIATFLRAQLK